MIQIEDSNNEKYHINPKQVVYVKERVHLNKLLFKILLVNGEVIMTSNEHGAKSIISSIKSKRA